MTPQTQSAAAADACHEEWSRLCRDSRAPKLRSIRAFAEQEIVLPDSGPYGGQRFRCSVQPFTGLWFDAIASRLFNRFAATGPSQSGKTLGCLVIPWMYHQFERGETTVVFAPGMQICEEKWLVDMLPTIQRSRYADLLPKSGRGSQGGFAEMIVFRNGTKLKFMSAGGDDAAKAAFTAKAAFGTEIDAMDQASDNSRESDPINQILARLRAHKDRRVYLECTVTTPRGRIWTEYEGGTCSRIVVPCAHCGGHVTPEREHFVGWDTAETELRAEAAGRFSCPLCGGLWSPEQRLAANFSALLVHKGQEIRPAGEIVGSMPETRTFSMRWSAVNNTFTDEAQLANEEWKAAKELDQENAQKARHQQVWCIPWQGEIESTDLNAETVASRLTGLDQAALPNDVETLVVQIDLHDRWHYAAILATGPNQIRSVVDYSLWLTPNPNIVGQETAIRLGLEQLADALESKQFRTADGRLVAVDQFQVDAGYREDIALAFVVERNAMAKASGRSPRWVLTKGASDYRQPTADADIVPGSHWHFSRQPSKAESGGKSWWLILTDKWHFVRQVHSGFAATPFVETGTRRPGSVAIFGTDPQTHLTPIDRTVARSAFAMQILGWRFQETETKRGVQMAWCLQYSQDHWLDCLYGCLVADSVVRQTHKRFKTPAPLMPAKEEHVLTEAEQRANAMFQEAGQRLKKLLSH